MSDHGRRWQQYYHQRCSDLQRIYWTFVAFLQMLRKTDIRNVYMTYTTTAEGRTLGQGIPIVSWQSTSYPVLPPGRPVQYFLLYGMG